jgi:hypothetical protein
MGKPENAKINVWRAGSASEKESLATFKRETIKIQVTYF